MEVSGLVCFKPDLERFTYYVRVIHARMVHKGATNPWARFCNGDDFLQYCLTCLRVYSHLTHNSRYTQHGFRSDSPGKIKTTTGIIHLPTYVLDMIREISRPMYCSNGVDVCIYMPLKENGLGATPGLGWTSKYSQISSLIRDVDFGIQTSVLVQEDPGKSPVFVATDANFAYANGSTCPAFRLETMAAMRHLRPQATFYLGYTDINSRPTPDVHYVPDQLSTLTVDPFGMPARRNYDDVTFAPGDGKIIHDATGAVKPMSEFALGKQTTCDLLAPLVIDGNQAIRLAVPLTDFEYGAIGSDLVHEIIRALNPNEAELSHRDAIRARMSLGTVFRYEITESVPTTSLRFPSDANPSLERLISSGATKPTGKSRRKKKGIRKKGSKPARKDEPNAVDDDSPDDNT